MLKLSNIIAFATTFINNLTNKSSNSNQNTAITIHTTGKKKKSGLSTNQAIRNREKFLIAMRDCFSKAINFHLTSEQLQENLKHNVYSQPRYQKSPKYVRSYINGWQDALLEILRQYHLDWRIYIRFPPYAYPDGEIIPGNYAVSEEPFCRLLTKYQIDHLQQNCPGCTNIWSWVESDKSCYTWKDFPNQKF